jgi:chromate reductase, NAD(P)H dehydrogenase (quinone)
VSGETRVLAIAGSLRGGSTNRLLLRAAAEAAPIGAVVEVWDGIAALPAFDEDAEAPVLLPVADLLRAIGAADALLIATPEYNGSVPGALKNAIDWASRPAGASALKGKPVAVVGASPSPFGAMWAQAELRKVLGIAGAAVLESGVSLGKAAQSFDDAGRLVDDGVRSELRSLMRSLAEAASPASAGRAA